MTEEELNRLEALAKAAKSGSLRDDDNLYMACGPATILSLIRLARIGLAVTPRPISEAPRAESFDAIIYGGTYMSTAATYPDWHNCRPDGNLATWNAYDVRWEKSDSSGGYEEYYVYRPTHFIPLSALPKPGGDATSKHHDWRISDSSLYDFKCGNCGTTDRSSDADLPCTKPGGE